MSEEKAQESNHVAVVPSLFAVTVRSGNMQLAAWERIPASDAEELFERVVENVIDDFVLQFMDEHGRPVLFTMGPGMEVCVWSQEDYSKWLEENRRIQERLMAEHRAATAGSVQLPPDFDPRRMPR